MNGFSLGSVMMQIREDTVSGRDQSREGSHTGLESTPSFLRHTGRPCRMLGSFFTNTKCLPGEHTGDGQGPSRPTGAPGFSLQMRSRQGHSKAGMSWRDRCLAPATVAQGGGAGMHRCHGGGDGSSQMGGGGLSPSWSLCVGRRGCSNQAKSCDTCSRWFH